MIQSFPGKLAFDDLAFDNFPIIPGISPSSPTVLLGNRAENGVTVGSESITRAPCASIKGPPSC